MVGLFKMLLMSSNNCRSLTDLALSVGNLDTFSKRMVWREDKYRPRSDFSTGKLRFGIQQSSETGLEICLRNVFMVSVSSAKKGLRNSMEFSFDSYLVKLASVWSVLATRVRFLLALSPGYSSVRLKREGVKMAGHRYLRKMQEEIKLSPRSGLPTSFRYPLILKKHLCNWMGK